jgi:predicted dehydrogenase
MLMTPRDLTRREVLSYTTGAAALLGREAVRAEPPAKPQDALRIGVISASIGGKAQKTNGHTWHFAQYLHPECNLDAFQKYVDPGSASFFRKIVRNPRYAFDGWPFPDTRLTQVYDADRSATGPFTEAFPGVQPAKSLEDLVANVDAVWLGDASGRGEDHYDLIAPALEKGLPCFCDKPIGGTVEGTRRILDLATKRGAPIMSSSLFRHEFGMEHALRLRDSGERGKLEYVIASMAGGYSPEGWFVYGQHPAWAVMTLLGPGVEAVSLYAKEATAHGLVTYADRKPAEIWYGRPDLVGNYNQTLVYFEKHRVEFGPAIEGDFWYGHHYEMFRMAETFRRMAKTRKEPIPHQEILEVTAIIHAGAKSLKEKSRLVALGEVL